MVHAWVGKEFPDMRQDEGRIKFIRGGDAVKNSRLAQGRAKPFHKLLARFL